MNDTQSHPKVPYKEPENSHYPIQLANSLIEIIQSLSLIFQRKRLIGRSLRMRWFQKNLQRKLLWWLIGCLIKETSDRRQTIILLDSLILIGDQSKRLKIYLIMRSWPQFNRKLEWLKNEQKEARNYTELWAETSQKHEKWMIFW